MLTFKEYLIEDNITVKLDDIKQRINADDTDEDVADTGFKRDRKWNIDKQRYSKMARRVRNQHGDDSYGSSALGNPEGMKTSGGPNF